jgi:hypothetical protein
MLWGAPRIHGELLMLGFNVSQATVSRYLRRCVRPRSPGWRSFLRTQLFSNGLRQAIDEGEAITEWREVGPGSAAANDVRPAKWMGDRWAAERPARGSAGRHPLSSGRINGQIHSLIERRSLHVRALNLHVSPVAFQQLWEIADAPENEQFDVLINGQVDPSGVLFVYEIRLEKIRPRAHPVVFEIERLGQTIARWTWWLVGAIFVLELIRWLWR